MNHPEWVTRGTRPPRRLQRPWRATAALLGVVVAAAVITVAAASPASATAGGGDKAATAPSVLVTTVPTLPGAPVPSITVASPRPSNGPTTSAGAVTPSPPATVAPGASNGVGSCGLLNVGCHVSAAINDWFRGLVTSAINPVLGLLGRTVLSTPDVTGGRVGQLWEVAAGIANAMLVLLVLAAGALVMGHETVQTRYAAKDIAPRLVVAVIAANTSLTLVSQAIPVANALSAALLGQGLDPAQAATVLQQMVLRSLTGGPVFLVLLGGVAAVLGLTVVASYVLRVALLVLLAAAAPLALIGHALPQTDGLARMWWRAVAGLFAIQVGQSLVLITALRVFFTSDGTLTLGLPTSGGLVDLLVACCLLWVMVRIPSWVSRMVFTGTGRRGSSITKVVKDVVLYKATRAGIAALA